MRGPFGGVLDVAPGRSREAIAPEISSLVGFADPEDAPPAREPTDVAEARGARESEREPPPDVAAVSIGFRVVGNAIEYDADLSSFCALGLEGGRDPDEVVAALSAVCERLARLHDEGRVHGDLRPALLGWSDSRPSLLLADVATDAPALLRARLETGATPSDVGFAAPEVAQGSAASSASDVYSLAATAYSVLARRAPLAMIDAPSVFAPLGDDAVEVLTAALCWDPTSRPTARTLADALKVGDAPRGANESMIGAVLLAGGAAVFTGVLALAVSRFSALGEIGKLSIALGTSLGILFSGVVLTRRGSERSGVGLMTVAAQLGWADAYLALDLAGLAESNAAWAGAGLVLGVVQASLAARFTSRVMGSLAALAFLVSAVTLGLLLPSGSIGAALYAAVVGVVYLALARVLAKLDTSALSRPLYLAAGVASFASVGLSLPALRDHALWSFVWPYLIAGTLVALGARSLGIVIAVLGPSFQALVLFDEAESVHVAALVTLAVAWLVGKRSDPEPLRRVACVIAAAWSVGSLFVSLVAITRDLDSLSLARHLLSPYLLALGHVAIGRRDHRRAATVLLSLGPLAQAVIFHRSIGPVLGAVGFGLLTLAFSARAKAREDALSMLIVGLAAAGAAPAAVALAEYGSWSRLLLVLLAAAGMLAIALGRARPREVEHRRLLEVASVLCAGGVPLLLSLAELRTDFLYAALALTCGVVFLVVALFRKRLVLSAASLVLVLVVIAIQYFAKLSQALHWGLLCLGFGLFLLFVGVLYERKLKAVLPKLNDWE